eukprot:SAG11_NODE_94_length_17057_cov_255.471754_8_plen_741_part_00
MQKSSPQPKRAEESESVMMTSTPAKERSGADGHGGAVRRLEEQPASPTAPTGAGQDGEKSPAQGALQQRERRRKGGRTAKDRGNEEMPGNADIAKNLMQDMGQAQGQGGQETAAEEVQRPPGADDEGAGWFSPEYVRKISEGYEFQKEKPVNFDALTDEEKCKAIMIDISKAEFHKVYECDVNMSVEQCATRLNMAICKQMTTREIETNLTSRPDRGKQWAQSQIVNFDVLKGEWASVLAPHMMPTPMKENAPASHIDSKILVEWVVRQSSEMLEMFLGQFYSFFARFDGGEGDEYVNSAPTVIDETIETILQTCISVMRIAGVRRAPHDGDAMRTMGCPGWRGNLYLPNECVHTLALTAKQANCATYVMTDYRLGKGKLTAADRDARDKWDIHRMRIREGFWSIMKSSEVDTGANAAAPTVRDRTRRRGFRILTRAQAEVEGKLPGGPKDSGHTPAPTKIPNEEVKTDFGEKGRMVTLRLNLRTAQGISTPLHWGMDVVKQNRKFFANDKLAGRVSTCKELRAWLRAAAWQILEGAIQWGEDRVEWSPTTSLCRFCEKKQRYAFESAVHFAMCERWDGLWHIVEECLKTMGVEPLDRCWFILYGPEAGILVRRDQYDSLIWVWACTVATMLRAREEGWKGENLTPSRQLGYQMMSSLRQECMAQYAAAALWSVPDGEHAGRWGRRQARTVESWERRWRGLAQIQNYRVVFFDRPEFDELEAARTLAKYWRRLDKHTHWL